MTSGTSAVPFPAEAARAPGEPVGGGTAAFAYHRSVAPMLWMFVAIAGTEMVVVHGLVALRWPAAALVLTALTLPALVWFVRAIHAMRRLPVLIEPDRLVMRAGGIKAVAIPLENIARVAAVDGLPKERRRTTLNLALLAHPNVVVELRHRLPGRRGWGAVAHRLDEPAAFVAAFAALGATT